MDIGQRIREIREDLGVPRTVLARRAGVAQNSLYLIETGRRSPSMAMLEKIAHELHTEPAKLLREPALPLDEAPEEGRIEQLGPLTSHQSPEPGRDEGLLGRTDRTLAGTIGEALPEAPELLRENVGHAYLDMPVHVLVEEVQHMDVAGIRERMFELRDEQEWLRSYHYRTYRSEHKTPGGRRTYRDRQRQLNHCLLTRLYALGNVARGKAKHLPSEEYHQIMGKIQEDLDFLTAGVKA